MQKKYLPGLAIVGLVFILGCNPQEQFRRLENEVNDLKVEVFRQRQEIQDLSKKSEEYRKLAADERARETRFRADTQESLRQLIDYSQSMSNRMNSGTVAQTARPQTRPNANPTTSASELDPDAQQLALAEKDFNSGNFSGAVDAVDNLIRYFPDSNNIPEALYLKGRALMGLREHAKAQEAFQKLNIDFPRSNRFVVARLNIGRCQLAQGFTPAAINTFEDIVRRYPNSPEARSANELLQELKNN